MIIKIKAALNALKAGEALADSANWKTTQNKINVLSAFLISIVGLAKAFGIEVPLVDTDINNMAYAFVTLIGLVNFYLTTATTTKIGFKNESNSDFETDSSII